MSITLSFTGKDRDEIQKAILEFVNQSGASELPQPAPSVQKSVHAVQATASAAPAAPPAASSVVTYADIAAYVPKAVAKYGRGKIVTLLEGFGAKTGKDLKMDDYPSVMEKLKSEYPL